MNSFRKINPASPETILNMTDENLAIMAAITGKDISIGQAPLIGRYGNIDGKRISETEPAHADLDFAFEWAESGELCRIYVGSRIHGPLMSWSSDGWRNCYGHGNHGKNGSHGGTWSSSSKEVWATMAEALENRSYKVSGIMMHKNRLIEGPALIEALQEIAKTE